jgi:hypothetical protein
MNQQSPLDLAERRKAIKPLLNSGRSVRHLDPDVGRLNLREIVAAATPSSSMVPEPAPFHVVAAMLCAAEGAAPLVGSAPQPVYPPEPVMVAASTAMLLDEAPEVCQATTVKVRKTRKKPPDEEPVPLEKRPYLSFKDTYRRYKVHTPKALYHLASQSQSYLRYPKAGLPSNGFSECVIDPGLGKKKLIIAEKYEQWLERK